MASDEGLAILLAHADRFWKAEETNATRLAARSNLVLSAVAAIIGLKIFAFGKELDIILSAPAGPFVTCLWCSGAFSIVLLTISLALLLGIRFNLKRVHRPASASLALEAELVKTPTGRDETDMARLVFTSTYQAATALQKRNAKRQLWIDAAQLAFFFAVILVFWSMGLYTWLWTSQRLAEKTAEEERVKVEHQSKIRSPRGEDIYRPSEERIRPLRP